MRNLFWRSQQTLVSLQDRKTDCAKKDEDQFVHFLTGIGIKPELCPTSHINRPALVDWNDTHLVQVPDLDFGTYPSHSASSAVFTRDVGFNSGLNVLIPFQGYNLLDLPRFVDSLLQCRLAFLEFFLVENGSDLDGFLYDKHGIRDILFY